MAAVPKRRVSPGRRNRRRANDGLKPRTLVECPNCRAKTLPHHVCPSCGHYRGVEVIEVKS
ncbi:MAG: 50S ribosomal protein L32 [Anaerolineae bacterium]|nr:50S ribosomal protein L32 [Anaerolineae bacterium]